MAYGSSKLFPDNLSFSPTECDKWTPSMVQNEHIWGLSVAEMFWFRDLYVPNVDDWTKPEVSPVLQEDGSAFEGMHLTWVSVTGMDVLRSEGEIYAENLQRYGVPVALKMLKGLPHTGVRADRVCTQIQTYYEELVAALKEAFT